MNGIGLTDVAAPVRPDFVGASLDEHVSRLIDALGSERTASWDAGDVLDDMVQGLLPGADQEQLFRWLASQTGCTTNRLKQLRVVAAAFEPGMRDLERAWSWHRAVYNCAKRNNVAPADILAMAGEWTQRELDAYGSDVERVTFSGDCLECGFDVRVACKKPGVRAAYKGWPLKCPVCEVPTPLGALA